MLALANDLSGDENGDKCLLQILKSAIKVVGFTNSAQLSSLRAKNINFDDMVLEITTDSQLEDNHAIIAAAAHKNPNILIAESRNNDNEDIEIIFTDRRFGRKTYKRSRFCSNNKRLNHESRWKLLWCNYCSSKMHMKFHRYRGGNQMDVVLKECVNKFSKVFHILKYSCALIQNLKIQRLQ